MLKNKFFAHSLTRKYVIAFGNLFDSIFLERVNESDETVQRIKVPLMYAPKDKALALIDQQLEIPERERQIMITLPRISYAITGFSYDPSRKAQKSTWRNAATEYNKMDYVFSPVPYNLEIELIVWARNNLDGLQIFEQIIPYFTPEFNVSITDLSEFENSRDIPIILEGVSLEDDFDTADEGSARKWSMTFNFNMKVWYYGYINTSSIISKAYAQLYTQMSNTISSNVLSSPRPNLAEERITITPDPTNASPVANLSSFITDFDTLYEPSDGS